MSGWWKLPDWVAAELLVEHLKPGLALLKWQASVLTLWMQPFNCSAAWQPKRTRKRPCKRPAQPQHIATERQAVHEELVIGMTLQSTACRAWNRGLQCQLQLLGCTQHKKLILSVPSGGGMVSTRSRGTAQIAILVGKQTQKLFSGHNALPTAPLL